jgi:flavorubredoxin
MMKAIRISPKVWWVGAIDWQLKEFHGYTTRRGSTYNAFLIMDQKITLVDTVKAPFLGEMMERIASVVDPAKIDVIVSNHAEMDHSGSLPETIARVNPSAVYASTLGVKALEAHFHDLAGRITPVKSGDAIELGASSLKFVETRMLHWPDSMFSFLTGDNVLFSQDGFGMHYAVAKIFADENDLPTMREEAERYYANILLPYSPQVLKLLEAFPGLGLDVAVIAPDHGPLWRGDMLGTPLAWYKEFAEQAGTPNALVLYDTMWHSTEKMAFAIADAIRETGCGVQVLCLASCTRSDAAAAMLKASALVVGSPTINNDLYPRTADVLTYLRGLRPKNMIGAAFGSFGWSGESVAKIEEYLKGAGVELVAPGLKVKYVPTAAALDQCSALGKAVGDALLTRSAQ